MTAITTGPSVRPLAVSFAEAGVFEALERSYALLRMAARELEVCIPEWDRLPRYLLESNFEYALWMLPSDASVALSEAGALVDVFMELERRVLSRMQPRMPAEYAERWRATAAAPEVREAMQRLENEHLYRRNSLCVRNGDLFGGFDTLGAFGCRYILTDENQPIGQSASGDASEREGHQTAERVADAPSAGGGAPSASTATDRNARAPRERAPLARRGRARELRRGA